MGEIAEDVIDGWCCSSCGIYFKTEHGYPVLCHRCWSTAPRRASDHMQEARHQEM